VERSRPIGPQSQVQKIAAAIIATGESPVLAPYSQGSTALLLINSITISIPPVQTSVSQPGSTAMASASGKKAEMIGPT
jgi:hypothetical protein